MILTINEIDQAIKDMLAREAIEELLGSLTKLAFQFSVNTDLRGNTLFMPQMDACMKTLSERFVLLPKKLAEKLMVYIATEVYETGGHTRLIEDTVRAFPEWRHIIILTNLSQHYTEDLTGLGFLKERFEKIGLEVIYLKEATFVTKCHELAGHLAELSPQAILLYGHHYDGVANAAVSAASAPHVLYIHHCDHNPGLGATRQDFHHLDVSPGCHDACKSLGTLSPVFLGMSVEDKGIVEFSKQNRLVGVTCGAAHKYEGRVEFTYGELVAQLFASGIEHILHVGNMSQQQMESIHREIHSAGQEPGRLIFQPNTPSLADVLKDIAPGFFLCSYPLGGGKAMIEAMSAGLPIINPRGIGTSALVCNDMSFGVAITVEKMEDVPVAVQRLQNEAEVMGKRNREVFEQHYSLPGFRKKLLDIISG